MNLELVQRIAVVGYGNSFLAGLLADPPELVGFSSAYDFVSSVDFDVDGSDELVAGTARWYSALRSGGVRRLRLAVTEPVPGPDGSGWVSFGDEFVDALVNGRPNAWFRTSDHDDGDDDRPYRVHFRLGAVREPERPGLSVQEAGRVLTEAVDRADAFARRARTGYGRQFAEARGALHAGEAQSRYSADWLPECGYPLEARQLLEAVLRASVMGGAGSWNDAPPEVETLPDYWEVTAHLQLALLDAALSAANAFTAN